MTLRELINSVDSEQYSDNQLYQKLRDIKPEYGSSKHIQVKVVDGDIAITNLHVGSLGDILAYPIDAVKDQFHILFHKLLIFFNADVRAF